MAGGSVMCCDWGMFSCQNNIELHSFPAIQDWTGWNKLNSSFSLSCYILMNILSSFLFKKHQKKKNGIYAVYLNQRLWNISSKIQSCSKVGQDIVTYNTATMIIISQTMNFISLPHDNVTVRFIVYYTTGWKESHFLQLAVSASCS